MSGKSYWHDCGFGIYCIDTGLFREGLAACYLLYHDGEAAFIDTGTRNSLPRLLRLLDDLGIAREHVRWVMPTHVHLDHAGGAGALMDVLPNATLVVHERGARHMITPDKLQAGSLAVYGQERYDAAFGRLVPVAEQRVIAAVDGDIFAVGRRELKIFDTPGHARHHYVVWDEQSRGFFTGDTFGVSYPELNQGVGRFIFPPTTPVQFDPHAWHESVDRLMTFQPDRVFLTHFGMHKAPADLAQQLHEQIDCYVNLARQLSAEFAEREFSVGSLNRELAARLMNHSLKQLSARACPVAPALVRQALAGDMELNAQGLVHWLNQSLSAVPVSVNPG